MTDERLHLNYEQARAALEAAAASDPSKKVAECWYHDGKAPACILGKALDTLGVDAKKWAYDKYLNTTSWDCMSDSARPITMDTDAEILWSKAQEIQDTTKHTWQEAYDGSVEKVKPGATWEGNHR